MTAAARASGVVAPTTAPEIYIQEQDFWPWGELLQVVTGHIGATAPHGARILDVMCGPGGLLASLRGARPDLRLEGLDVNPSYVAYARKEFPDIAFQQRDAMDVGLTEPADVLVCTGSLHHLSFDAQRPFLQQVASLLAPQGYFILGEEVFSPYENESERRAAAVELGAALLTEAIRRAAPDTLLTAAIDVMVGDLFFVGEYKLDLPRLRMLVEEFFEIERCQHVWPAVGPQYGDYVFICKPRR